MTKRWEASTVQYGADGSGGECVNVGDVVIDRATAAIGVVTDVLGTTLYVTYANGQAFSYQPKSVMTLGEYLAKLKSAGY